MLLSTNVEIVLSGENIKYYENLGYYIPRYYNKRDKKYKIKRGTKIKVEVKHLPLKSNVGIVVKCDNCNKTLNITYQSYNDYKKENGKYYCMPCSHILYSSNNATCTKIKKSKSFEQWCIENDKQDILDRWDYELNNCRPSEIAMKSKKRIYFKCPRGIHESETKTICDFTCGCEGSIKCIKCNSFGQFLLDDFGDVGILRFWSNKNTKDLFKISKYQNGSQGKVWIKCDNTISHDDYKVACDNFVKGSRCPKCNQSKGENQIELILKNNNILFLSQYKFIKCKRKSQLPFDFYLPDYNICIEYQGVQHYVPIDFAGRGEVWANKLLKENQIKDQIKRDYCKSNNINLIEIPYWNFDSIEEILEKELSIMCRTSRVVSTEKDTVCHL